MNYQLAKKIRNDKLIFIFCLVLMLYFIFLILTVRFPFGASVMVGVFRELLDIPAFIMLAVFLVISIISLIKQNLKLKSYPFYSIIILLLTIISLIIFIRSA